VAPDLKRVHALCTHYGVTTVEHTEAVTVVRPALSLYHREAVRAKRGWQMGPSLNTWVHWRRKRVAIDYEAFFNDDDAPNVLIHELAHCLAPQPPHKVLEPLSLMLAFEYQAHRELKIDGWSHWMRDYTVARLIKAGLPTDYANWPSLTTRARGEILTHSRMKAIQAGVLRPDGKLAR
jgi:hypothetical protein